MRTATKSTLAAAFMTLTVALTACTSSEVESVVTVTTSLTPPTTTEPPISEPPTTADTGQVPASDTAPALAPLPSAPGSGQESAATGQVTPTSTPPGPAITVTPTAGTGSVSPLTPVTVSVDTGTLVDVLVTNPEGRAVTGELNAAATVWTSTEPLGYNRNYTVDVDAIGEDLEPSTSTTSFTTLKPKGTIFPSFYPNPDMKTVGVGQPMVVIFDKPPSDRAAAERALTVTTTPAVTGAWYWWDERTLHYRPETYWAAGTKITVNAKIYGLDLGGGMYGETDRTLQVTVGASKIAKIDNATKQMEVFIDGELERTIPVSLGQDKTIDVEGTEISLVTPSGTYVAQEKYELKRMDSSTYGLPTDYDLGYDKEIPLAVRISAGGIFVHSAPWSVADQGIRNVSHGCVNINPEAAAWFYETFSYGDIVTVTGTTTQLAPTDGFGDWNISWEDWQKGSAIN